MNSNFLYNHVDDLQCFDDFTVSTEESKKEAVINGKNKGPISESVFAHDYSRPL